MKPSCKSMCVTVALGVLALPCGGLTQQEGVLVNPTPADLEAVLESLKIDFKKSREKPAILYHYVKDGQRTTLWYYLAKKELMLQALFKGTALERLNAWNDKTFFSRAYLRKSTGESVLEWNLDIQGDVTKNTIRRFIRRFEEEMSDFREFLGEPKKSASAMKFSKDQVKEVTASFPFDAKGNQVQLTWKVHYIIDRRNGLCIVGAWLKGNQSPRWLKVVHDLRVTDLYVPYADNSNRFFDMELERFPQHGPWPLDELATGKDNLLGPHGRLLNEFTVREDRDAGLLWLYSDQKYSMTKQGSKERRGKTFAVRRQEMILWSVFQASNYFYIMQYAFQNDGSIRCRVGSTGRNFHTRAHKTGHMHNTLWRIQLDIGGSGPEVFPGTLAANQRVFLVKHEESDEGQGKATTRESPVQNEGGWDWDAREFTAIRVSNPDVKNRVGSAVAYDVVSERHGSSRHYAPKRQRGDFQFPSDQFTQHDFWLTNDSADHTDQRQLPAYVVDKKPLQGAPVIWHHSSNLHVPRDEDFLDTGEIGCAIAMFSGFQLTPRHLFVDTPYLKTVPLGLSAPANP